MHEISFKAKRIDNGEWIESQNLIKFTVGEYYMPKTDEQCDCKFDKDGNILSIKGKIYRVDPSTVCQYTGLTDKNGKKIWENDIVKQFADCDETGKSLYFFYKIRWDKKYSAFEGIEIYSKESFLFPDLEDIEVIGNIFDNPKLLEEGAE